ncbi:MAG: nucleotidyltransferase [Planctomycetota bacterium]
MPPKLLLQVLADFYERLEERGVSPVVAGGLAVSFWGHPRSTQDIDLAIVAENLTQFEQELRAMGLKPSKLGRWVDLGFVKASQWTVSIEDQYIDCQIDFLASNSEYFRQAMDNAISVEFTGIDREVRVLTLEDLLLFKAASGRLIDLADIKTLSQIHRGNLDEEYLAAKGQELKLPIRFWLTG